MSVGRKIFHCVVDDTALTASIGEIKKWTSQGSITLIVPLYTLERLRALKKSSSQAGMNARESVRFLDRVTSGKHSIPASKVLLQGPMEQYEDWEQAEVFLLPEFKEEVQNAPKTLVAPHAEKPEEEKDAVNGLAAAKEAQGLNEMSQMLLSKLNFKKSADGASALSEGTPSLPASPSGSSRPSPECSPRLLDGSKSDENGEEPILEDDNEPTYVSPAVPPEIKPLLNSILWRVHAQADSAAASSSCILVTNNRSTQIWAQKFGITVKSIPQLRTSIIYEEKEFKNHCKYLEKNQNQVSEPRPLLSYEDESDEDVLVFVPRGQGKPTSPAIAGRTPTKASPANNRTSNGQVNGRSKVPATAEPAVEVPSAPIDPDSFSRNYGGPRPQALADSSITNITPRGPAANSIPRPGNGRRGGPPRGGMFRGGGRGRGKLWVP